MSKTESERERERRERGGEIERGVRQREERMGESE